MDNINFSDLRDDLTYELNMDNPYGKKLVLVGERTIEWLAPDAIKDRKASELKVNDSLPVVIGAIKRIDMANINLNWEELINLKKNLVALNRKIKKHNTKIENNPIYSLANTILKKVFHRTGLKYSVLDGELEKLEQKKLTAELNGLLENLRADPQVSQSLVTELLAKIEIAGADVLNSSDATQHQQTILEILVKAASECYPNLSKEVMVSTEGLKLLKKIATMSGSSFLLKVNDETLITFFNKFPNFLDVHRSILTEDQLQILRRLIELGHHETLQQVHASPNLEIKLITKFGKTIRFLLQDLAFDKQQRLDSKTDHLTREQLELLEELIRLNHKKTIDSFLKTPLFQQILHKTLALQEENAFPNARALDKAFLTYKKTAVLFEKKKGFFNTLLFIEKNWSQIQSRTIGTPTHREPGRLKIKVDAHHAIHYDTAAGGHIYIKRFLGKGGFKVVKQIYDLNTNQVVVQARQKLSSSRIKQMSKKEEDLMTAFKGVPHVVQYHSVSYYDSSTKKVEKQSFIMPLYNMGSLSGVLKKLNPKEKLKVAKDIIEGIRELHRRGYIHRDLKPDNIFVNKVTREDGSEEIEAVVGDLGLMCLRNKLGGNHPAGTPSYEPPEYENEQVGYEADLWGLGLILYELFKGDVPSMNKHANDLSDNKLMYQKLDKEAAPADKNSVDYVIWGLLRRQPKQRPTLEKALKIVDAELSKL